MKMSLTNGNDDRDLSTDILEYVLQRGEMQNDKTIASDILGFVKKKIEDSDIEEIPPELFKFVLEGEDENNDTIVDVTESDYEQLLEAVTDPIETEIIIEDLLQNDEDESDFVCEDESEDTLSVIEIQEKIQAMIDDLLELLY